MFIKDLNRKLKKSINDFLRIHESQGLIEESSMQKLKTGNIIVSQPKNKDFGDFSTNAAMVLAPVLKQGPLNIAKVLGEKIISSWPEVCNIKIMPPGFINFELNPGFIKKQILKIPGAGSAYGFNSSGRNKKINIEFVSANPTGKLHVGHGRWAVLGDCLSNIYAANGYDVWREYYINDYGSQIDKYSICLASLYLKAFGYNASYPKDGYPQEQLKEIADIISEKYGREFLKTPVLGGTEIISKQEIIKTEQLPAYADTGKLGTLGANIMISGISGTLGAMHVKFDEWFKESSLYENSNFEDTISALRKKKIVYEKDNALWFKSSEFGDDKDRVIVRSGGEPTYFASDIMYLANKVERGFKKLIYILGADHHGYVKRIHAIGSAIGFNGSNIEVIIGQLVRLMKKGQLFRMSKRKGKIYNLDDLIKDAGPDAIRFFFSANSFDTHMDFDLDLAKQKSSSNPVYYVQYAHARIASIVEKVLNLLISGELVYDKNEFFFNLDWYKNLIKKSEENSKVSIKESAEDFEKIINAIISSVNFKNIDFKNAEEIEIAKTLITYPDVIYDACCKDSPHLISQYLYKLASSFHYFYKHYRVIDKNKLNLNRLKLVLITRIVLANALGILKVSLPVKM